LSKYYLVAAIFVFLYIVSVNFVLDVFRVQLFGFTCFAVPDGGVSFLLNLVSCFIDVIHYCLLGFYCFTYRASCSVCFYL